MGVIFVDEAHKQTDRAIATLERRIHKVYADAQHDIEKKTADFWEGHAKRDEKYRKQLADGKITKEQYRAWMQGQVFQGERWEAKERQIARMLTLTDSFAQQIINDSLDGVFLNNANWAAYAMEHGTGIDFGFDLYNADAVARLLRDQPRLLPKYKLDIPKDMQWNKSLISQQITQGIIQGESLDKIAKRLELVTDRDENLCRTRARTAMTGAQNAGRGEAMARANRMGIHTKKRWLATLDGHTRTEHRDLDGQSVEENESFRIGRYKIRYPGDPQAHPAMVYNCRCTMIPEVVDYPDTDEDGVQRRDNISGQPIRDMSYKEWLRAKEAGEDLTAKKAADLVNYFFETEKAIKLKIIVRDIDLEDEKERMVWVPKSQLSENGVPGEWITNQKAQEFYSFDRSISNFSAEWEDKNGRRFSASQTKREKEIAEKAVKRFMAGKASYEELIEKAKKMGVKGVRKGMKRSTIEAKIKEKQIG